ncbi:protein kinase [Myxococcota bacterium]|nr:protein kinase [Myxococcota bacterium]
MSGEASGPEAGAVLGGRYRLVEILGHGGTGTVWAGHDLAQNREVAIKVLRSELTRDARLRRRLRREARAVARLEHPNIVRLFGMGDLPDGSPYLAMERVHGVPLHHLLSRGLPLARVVSIFEQVLAALAFAHARGVIHRDLKPQNVQVMRGAAGEDVVKLLDFGFARVENDSDDGLTAAVKDVFGTPTYMSPEQATGDHEVGPAADLYAVGVMLWEALCGSPPFTGATGTAVVVQHVTAPLPPFAPRPDFLSPAGLEAAIRQALEKEPVRRHASAAAFRRALLAAFEEGDADDDSFTTVNAVTSVTSVMTSAQPPAFERTGTDPGMTSLAPARAIDAGATPTAPVAVGDFGPSRDDLPLVGREALQRWLWERAVDTCQTGQPHFVLLDGPVGIGKSRLCGWLHQTMAEGGWMWPLKGRHRIGSADGGLRDVVRAALGLPRQAGSVGRDAVAQALAELDPEGTLDPQLLTRWLWPLPERPCPPGSAVRLVEQLARRLSRRRPLYLWLDDVHHADGEAFVIFDHLASNLTARPAPVFVVATRRTDAPASATPALDAMAAFLKRHHERIELREVPRLDERAVQALAAHAAPLDAAAVSFISGAARGNPLHALELVRYLQDAGHLSATGTLTRVNAGRGVVPRNPVELVRARLQGALHGRDPELATLAERLALLGGAFAFAAAETVARRIGLDAVRLDTGLEALVRLGVLADDAAETYAFRHELVREALADELADRSDAPGAHLAVAEALLAVHGERAGEVALTVARHFRAAGDVARAVERQLAGAQYARSLGQVTAAVAAHQEAERWLSEVEPTPALQAMLADCWRGLAELALDQNDTERALRLAERLETWARMVRDHGRAATALRLRGEAQLAAGRWLEAEKLLGDARARFETMGDARVVAQIDLALGRAALQSSRVEVAQACFARAAVRFASAKDLAGEAACRRALGELAVRAGDRATATRLLTEAAAMGDEALDHRLVGQAAWRLGELLRQGGQAEAAVGRYQQAVDNCEAVGDLAGLGRALRGLGDTERMLERATAESSYRRAVEVFESIGDQFQLAICHTQIGRMAAERDDLITAEAAFERALRTLESFDDPVRVGVLHAYLARIADRRGDRTARDHRLQVALRIDANRPLVVREWPVILEDVAAHLVAEGEPHRARALRERAAQIWTALGRPEDAARCLAGG